MLDLFIALWPLWGLFLLVTFISIFKPKIKGFLGEKVVSVILSRLDPKKYRVINDVMLNISGKTSQIDHLVVSNYGLFVIEAKNYKGWIVGDERSEYWTQVIYKRKEKLYNPIRQNYGHVQALKRILDDYPDIPIIPIVVFSINANLKVNISSSEVVYSVNLLKTIKKYSQEVVSDRVKEAIFSRIASLNIDDKELKKQHVSLIHKHKQERAQKINKDICPRCGGLLIVRKGRYGKFKGCSNFPKCRFTA